MNWSILFGGLKTILPSIKEVAEVFFGNKKERDQTTAKNDYDEQVELHKEQAAGYTHNAVNRNWFDSLVDGVNRLVRPLMTYGIIALFLWAGVDPARFTVTMAAMNTIPDMLWTIMAMILGFWFGSRVLAKDLPSQASAARKELDATPSVARRPAKPEPNSNPYIDDWKNEAFTSKG